MVTYFQAIVLGLLQGISELFPISSLGHSVIFPKLVGWNLNQGEPFFLTFLVATHLATAIVLFLFFLKDWVKIISGLWRSLKNREIKADDHYAKLGWLLVVGTIPAGILGLLLQDQLRMLFASAKFAAFFLIVNGLMLYGGEILRKRAPADQSSAKLDQRLAKLSWLQAFKVGISQVISLIPGMSRSGSTMVGSLMIGLSHEDAARFSFLLATPIIGAAAVLKLPDFVMPENHWLIGPAFVGAICSGVTAYFSIKFLTKYFHTNKLTLFAIYCVLAGIISSVIFYFR